MSYNQYEYEYHDLLEDTDYIDQETLDESWSDEDNVIGWENYYHNLTNEIED